MKTIAVLTDSNSGITQKEAEKIGVTVVSMPFMIDGKTYYEDIDLTQEQFYSMLKNGSDISTSQPSIASITDCWNDILKNYDELVYIPMSSGLSSSCQTALMLSQNFDGKVYVVNNQRISVTQKQSVIDALNMVSAGFDAKTIKEYLEKTKFDSSIYITLETLKYLKKGGRITPAAAAMASVLKIKPILQIQGEKLDSFSKARTKKLAKKIMISAINDDIENRFKSTDISLHIAYSGTDKSEALEFKKEIEELFSLQSVVTDPLSLSVACHIGDGALAIAYTKNIDLNNIN